MGNNPSTLGVRPRVGGFYIEQAQATSRKAAEVKEVPE
jgi:hypothetical protein